MSETSLFLVPTPIGNLDDITLRSIKVLKIVDLILAEDTRKSGQLLKHLEIERPLKSLHAHNEHKLVGSIVLLMQEGKKLAFVSDAGTPGISDPGYLLVREALKNDIKIECLPGATAFVPALVKSGLPCDKFVFEGFLPHKKGRQTRLNFLKEESRTMIFYESPHRILKTLAQFIEFFGEERKVSVSRELTKLYEETINGSLKEVLEYYNHHTVKGEFVIILDGKDD